MNLSPWIARTNCTVQPLQRPSYKKCFKSAGSVIAACVLIASGFDLTSIASAQSNRVNFGSVNVGTTSTALPVTLTFNAAGSIGSSIVLTQGAAGLDFVDAGSGTCVVAMAYSAGQQCTVNVAFTPRLAGTRYGAAVIHGTSGNVLATGYVQGTGVGPQVNYLPGTETTIVDSGLSYPSAVAVDGSGNVYIMDTNNARLVKATPGPSGYSMSTVTTGLSQGGGYGLAVDGAGNLYLGDTGNQRVLKEEPSPTGYIETTIASGFGYPGAVAADGSGNVFVIVNDSILEFTLSPSGYAQSTAVAYVPNAQGLAVDSVGNLYVAEQGYGLGNFAIYKETLTPNGYVQTALTVPGQRSSMSVAVDGFGNVYYLNYPNVYKQTLTPNGYVESTIVTGLTDIGGAYGVAVDGSGNLFIGYAGGNSVVKADFADPPTLNFASTPVGTTSPDSPLTVTIVNSGNAPLLFEVPSVGTNPSISQAFTLDSSGTSACPLVPSSAASPGTLNSEANCLLPISYTPLVSGPATGTLLITDNNLNAPGPAYASQSVNLNGTGIIPTFAINSEFSTISLNQGASTTSNLTITSQAGFSVNASLSVSGLPNGVTATFSQNPTRDSSVLTLTASNSATPGSTTVTITGTFGSEIVTTTIALKVNYVIPFYLSNSPQNLTVLRGFSGTSNITVTDLLGFNGDVNFTTSGLPSGVTALFSPNPASSASVLTLTASTSAPTGRYQITIAGTAGTLGIEYASVILTISATPQINWQNPAPITYGTPLSATQLNASAAVPGVFGYGPDTGAILGAGKQPLFAFFTPTDIADYTTASATVYLTVNKATPAISWPTPAPVTYGTALSAAQLNATANVSGTFAYSPASGTVLPLGIQTLNVVFTPTDTTDYSTATATVQLTVNKPSPTITWPTPAAITYGTPLSASQLNATANVPGTFSYSPAVGAVLSAGIRQLTVTFTPTDTTTYTTATASVPLTVNKATPVITWPAPAPINYGTVLSAAQLNATANVPGTFSYSPAAGTVLTAGAKQLTVTFTPTDTTDYATATATVSLTVNKATPTITWPTPAPISYGTPLSSAQLNATANTPGTFTYSPAAGTVLPAGTNTLHVTFTPTDSTDYNSASASVALVVTVPGFSITASPSSVSVKQGAKASSAITIIPSGGFTGNVSLSASGLPKGVSATFSPSSTKTSSTVAFSANGSASLGTATVTIVGKSGSLTQTTTIVLTVTHK